MKIVNKLTYSHLKTNKKRTVVTIMGIIISVAMVTAVFTSTVSFMAFLQSMCKAYDGEWYSQINDVSLDDEKILLEQDNVDSVVLRKDVAVADLDLENENAKNQATIIAANDSIYKNYNINLSSGTTPKTDKEIVVAQYFIDDNKLNWKVGDTVKFDAFALENDEMQELQKMEYKIVGITDSEVSAVKGSGMITAIPSDYKGSDFTATILNTKLNNDIWDTMKSNAKCIGRDVVDDYNAELFQYSGIFKDNAILVALGGFAGIILAIILVASVFMIYNSFAVSFQQRSRYLGMLASIGATKKQKRSSIYYEGFLLGLIGIPLGILSGIGGIAVTFKCISGSLAQTFAIPVSEPLKVHINWVIILGSILVSAFTIFISAFIPARKASKTTAIDAIRQTNTVKVKSRKLKSSKLAGKLFGFEGQLALKNYKRNGRRSRTITSALAISVILFLTVTGFTGMFNQLFSSNFYGNMSDIYIQVDYKEKDNFEKELAKVSAVDGYNSYTYSNGTIKDYEKYLSADGKKYKADHRFQDILVVPLDENSFKDYCKKIGVDSSKYLDKKNPQAILVNRVTVANVDGKRSAVISTFDKSIEGQKISGEYTLNSGETTDISYTIGDITKEDVNGDTGYFSDAYIVMPIDSVVALTGDTELRFSYSIAAKDHAAAFKEIETYLQDNGVSYSGYDVTDQMSSMKALMTIVNVFVYGFISLITLISIMNIINTISTSMDERRREFAMIKSVGLTPKSFKKMIYLESIYYGIKALIWGLPLSVGTDYLMYYSLSQAYDYGFSINWIYYIIAVVAVFLIIGVALLYSTSKIKHDNIIETLKSDDV